MINDYFHRASTKWSLPDFCHHFLSTAPEPQRTMDALSNAWTSSLDAICCNGDGKESRKARKAQLLREQWNKGLEGRRSVKAAFDSYKMRPSTINNSTFLGDVGTVFGGSIGVLKVDSGKKKDERSENRRKRSPSPSSPTPSDDEAPLPQGRKKKKKPDAASDWRQRFLDMYHSMDPSKKLRLSTGTVVEDVIFTYASRLEKPTPAHAFIIDANNVGLEEEFGMEEWTEILMELEERRKELGKAELPKCLQWVPNSVTTTTELRKILYGPEQPQGSDEEWVADVYRQFLFLLEHPDKPLTRDQCENWFEVTLLGRLVNRCIMTLPSVEVRCKESMSVATRGYLNRSRVQTGEGNHLLPSPRLDAIFRIIQPAYELGGCEVGKHDGGQEDTKRIDDFNKLVPMLSHMLKRLHAEVKTKRPHRMEVVGLLCSGLTIQPLRMHSINGYTCFLIRDEPLRIPSNERRIRDVRKLLESMWLVKKTINDTVELLWTAGDEDEEEEVQNPEAGIKLVGGRAGR